MTSRNKILGMLPPYSGKAELLARSQTVPDIIQGLKKTHGMYVSDYDKIYPEFLEGNAYDTGLNIFNFLRNNCFYNQESEKDQTLRSPAAIVATGNKIGLDCKNYSLFAGGILDAINRNTDQYIPFVYRFVSDNVFDRTPNHVFIVMYPDAPDEDQIWIDPIPEVRYYNYHIPYYYKTDKNISAMSLQRLSGSSFGMVNGGAFGIGEDKLRSQMMQFISQYPLSFMYLFLPTGQPGVGQDHNMNTAPGIPGIPQVIIDKKNKAFHTAWDWGMPTGLDTVTQIWPAIRNAVTTKLGMTPEDFWSRALGVTINQPAVGAANVSDVANVVLPGSGTVVNLASGVLSSFVPDLTWTYSPDQFAPVVSDWTNTKWDGMFVNSGQDGLTPVNPVNTGIYNVGQPQSTNASLFSNPVFWLFVCGGAYYIMKK